MSRKLLCAILSLTVALTCTACGGKETPAASGAPTASAPAPEAKTELVIAITKDINSIDPHVLGNTLTSAVQANMYEWLIKRDADNNLIPGLADSWTQVDDTTWSFHLREGVQFHSGNPLTSADVQFSLMRIQGDQFTERSNYVQIKEVKIIDDANFEIITNGPDPALLNRISRLGSGILDSKLFQELGEEEYTRQVSGTGPYKLERWSKDSSIVMVKNDNYWGDDPTWEKVTFRVIPEESTRTAELLTGGVDVALDISPAEVERVNSNPGTHVESFSTSRVLYWVVRTSTEGLNDVRVRQAIDYAIDDQMLIDTIYGGAGTPTQTIVAPGVFGSNPDLVGTCRYDLEKAKQLLADSGYEGLRFELASGNGQYLKDKELTELVAAMLDQAGFQVELNIMDTSRFTEIKNAREFHGLRMNGYSSSMSDAFKDLTPFSQENPVQLTDWHNAEFDQLFAESETMMDREQREANYRHMQELMDQELPVIPMLLLPGYYGVSDQLDYTPRSDEYIYVNDIHVK